jgi:hypothetical protein
MINLHKIFDSVFFLNIFTILTKKNPEPLLQQFGIKNEKKFTTLSFELDGIAFY